MPTNPMPDTAFGGADALGEPDEPKLTHAEIAEMFGERMPIEAVGILGDPLPTCRETRAKLKEIATSWRASQEQAATTIGEAAYRYACETWSQTWTDNEIGSLAEFAALAATVTENRDAAGLNNFLAQKDEDFPRL